MPASSASQRSGTGGRVRPRRDFQALAERRMAAAEMFARGMRHAASFNYHAWQLAAPEVPVALTTKYGLVRRESSVN
jgi:hypothetical protein